MKPNPLSPLKNFTVPLAYEIPLFQQAIPALGQTRVCLAHVQHLNDLGGRGGRRGADAFGVLVSLLGNATTILLLIGFPPPKISSIVDCENSSVRDTREAVLRCLRIYVVV
jgi:hypothetical protein